MARTRALVLFVAALLALSGCKAFFDFNAFSSLDKASVPNPSRYQGAGGLANLQADLGSSSIVDALKGDPATVATILANLNSSYGVTGTLTTPDQQTAAILYSDLALKSTSGDALVNNIVASVMTTSTGNLGQILQSVVPPTWQRTSRSSPTWWMVSARPRIPRTWHWGLRAAAVGAPPGMNMGDVTQKATVSYLMVEVFNAVTRRGSWNRDCRDVRPREQPAEHHRQRADQPRGPVQPDAGLAQQHLHVVRRAAPQMNDTTQRGAAS